MGPELGDFIFRNVVLGNTHGVSRSGGGAPSTPWVLAVGRGGVQSDRSTPCGLAVVELVGEVASVS